MTTVPFDTLKLATKLEQSGFTADQAKGASSAFAEAFADELVTKSYLDHRLDLFKSDIDSRFDALRLSTKADIADAKADTVKWMFGAMGFQTVVILAAVLALVRFGH